MTNQPEIFVKQCRWIQLQLIKDGIDGTISVAESQIPFKIKRVYYIYNLNIQNAIRGKHAHKMLEQVIFCINGSCEMKLDDGRRQQSVVLNKANTGLYLGIDLWHIMNHFSSNCILLVLASDIYRESDYIRDYDTFIRYINQKDLKNNGS